MDLSFLFFYLFAAVAVGAALVVVLNRNILHCAMALVLMFFAIAALFLMLGAEFIAAVQVLVYAGAIMVLFLFVILLIQIDRVQMLRFAHRQSPLVVIIAVLLLAELLYMIIRGTLGIAPGGADAAAAGAASGSTEAFGALLYTTYLFPFEVASVLLLAAMIGAILLARLDKEEVGGVSRQDMS
ncbi:MAG: NADH-quinone oxidoreductase subunit J [Candidatus Tectomicrobia bacterium]|nr:NADH-quinone oxidoreductase subunit J [Candidatus Tectomicrobia bacterium]